jgi:hypothetical protein
MVNTAHGCSFPCRPAYKTELAWGKKQLSLAPAAAALTLTRPTPPSIPCLHDSFG